MAKVSKGGRSLSKNEKILLGLLCAVALFFVVNILIIEPSNKKIKPLQDEVSALKDQVADINGLDSSIKEKEKELEGLKVEFEEASKSIPKTDRYPQVIRDIESMAGATSITVSNYSLSKPSTFASNGTREDNVQNAQSGLQMFTVQMTLKGEYTNVLSFINKLESDSRIKEVITLSSTKDSSNISIVYYVAGGIDIEDYNFNDGSYGKSNPFN